MTVVQRSTDGFKLWDLNTDKAPSATPILKKTCSHGRAHYNDSTNSVFTHRIAINNRDSISFSALGTLLHQLICSVCVNIHSNKRPRTPPSPSGHLKHGPYGHRINFLGVPSETRLWFLHLPSFGYLSQVWKLSTTPLLCHLDTDRDQLPPSTTTTLENPLGHSPYLLLPRINKSFASKQSLKKQVTFSTMSSPSAR